ncbi:hypothetical protein SAMN05421543_10913 [Alicyclobacillus macrosporangiidus]|uniref:Uncharacterized protein n=1 Tax=Alicyclobacillus macrosporangiidus TaxID=392015 RepID=A0A1I7J8X5_9BACL|nr:hypothetical protein SAMN05421543_10913 [Alicyclobacillus macrosporangiidus]
MEHNTITLEWFDRFIQPGYECIRPLFHPYSVSGLIIGARRRRCTISKREEVLSELKRLVDDNGDVDFSLCFGTDAAPKWT